MKNLFCNHTPSEEDIKEAANVLGLFRNLHLLACDINDVKVILNGATNYILVEGIGNGSGRLSNAIEDAVIRCCGIAKAYNLFSADKLLLHLEYNSGKPLWVEELEEVHTFMDMFEKDIHFITDMAIDNEKMKGDTIVVRILATNYHRRPSSSVNSSMWRGDFCGKCGRKLFRKGQILKNQRIKHFSPYNTIFHMILYTFVSKQKSIAYGSKYLWALRMADRTI